MDSAGLDFGHASIILSLLLGVLCVGRIRSFDVHETESYLKLFLVAVYGGLVAAALGLAGYRLASALGFKSFHSWYGFLLLVGPIEEAAKYAGFRLTRLFYGPRLNESTDGVVYMASVALGFSLIENFMYANAGIGNGHLLWLRLLLATPGHILFSFPMGLSHYLAREEGHPRWTVAASFALASLTHGIYNNLCSLPLGILFAPLFLLFLWTGLLSVLRYSHTTSPFRTALGPLLRHLPASLRRGLRCHQCGFDGEMPHFAVGKAELQRCGECGHFVISRDNALRLFHRLAPEFRNLEREFRDSPAREGYRALYGVVHVHEESGAGFFHGDLFDAKLSEITSGLRLRLEKRTFIRFLFQTRRPRRPHQPAQPSAPVSPRPPPRREKVRWRDLVLAALGMTLCAVWGVSHLADIKLVSWHPALSEVWQDSTMSVAYPRGWHLNVWTSGDGRQVSVNLEAQGRAAMAIRGQAWEVVPPIAAGRALDELLETLGAAEKSRRPLENWGRYAGSGSEVEVRSSRGRDLGLAVFAHSSDGRSFVAVEMVDAGHREPMRQGMDLVRRTLRLKRKPTLPDGAAAGTEDSLVTRALRDFLRGDGAPALPDTSGTAPAGLPGPPPAE